jgi:hypothetical protein
VAKHFALARSVQNWSGACAPERPRAPAQYEDGERQPIGLVALRLRIASRRDEKSSKERAALASVAPWCALSLISAGARGRSGAQAPDLLR